MAVEEALIDKSLINGAYSGLYKMLMSVGVLYSTGEGRLEAF